MRFHCLQHVPFETPGILAGWVLGKGHSLDYTHLYKSEPLPSEGDFDGLIIMGGPMSVHDEGAFPWLPAEKELIAAAIRGEKKVLGICLGAQLIAEVAGGRVYPNPVKEIGFWPVQWTDAAMQWTKAGMGPSASAEKPFPGLRDLGTTPVFHWHGETFDLPPGAILLASTGPCTNQAFLLGKHILGLQFHPEVTSGIIREMIAHEGHELVPAPYIQSAADILRRLLGDQIPPPSGSTLGESEWLLDAGQLPDILFRTFFND